MKYIFLGSGAIAESCLGLLVGNPNRIKPLGIIADRSCLSAGAWQSKCACIELDPNDRKEKEVASMIGEIKPDFLISVQYPWILPSGIIDMVPDRAFNIHNAKLPDYRGHNSLTYSILNGDRNYVSTLHIMDVEVDRGFIVKTEEIAVFSNDTAVSLWGRSVTSCITLFCWLVFEGNFLIANSVKEPIVGRGKYYSKQQISKDKEIPPNCDIKTLDRYARAFYFPPHEPAHLKMGEKKIYVIPTWDGQAEIQCLEDSSCVE